MMFLSSNDVKSHPNRKKEDIVQAFVERLVDANLLLGQVCQTRAQTIVGETQNDDVTNV